MNYILKNKKKLMMAMLICGLLISVGFYSVVAKKPKMKDTDWDFWTNPPHMFSNVTGNIGIGTNDPKTTLHVFNGNSGGSEPDFRWDPLAIENDDFAYLNIITPSNKYGGVMFSDNQRGRGAVNYDHTQDKMRFYTNHSSRVAIDSMGNVGIGIENPIEELQVAGDVMVDGEYKYESDKTYYLNIPACGFKQAASADRIGYHINYWGFARLQGVGAEPEEGVLTSINTPLYLPNGSTITNLTVYYYDNNETEDIFRVNTQLCTRKNIQLSKTVMAWIPGKTEGAKNFMQTSFNNTITSPVIDNYNNQYFIDISMGWTYGYVTDGTLGFWGCKLEYKLDTISY